LGGTGFFGIDLVNHLLDSGWDVTVATRGMTPARFNGEPVRIKTDRHNPESLKRLAEAGTWDVLFDQRCFSSYDANIALEALQSKVGKIVLTSSTAVYAPGSNIRESDFDPTTRSFQIGPRKTYDDGKRDAEAVYTQRSPVPVALGRLAVVLGFPDSSNRIEQHVRAVASGSPIYLPNPEARTSLISRQDAGRFIASLGIMDVTGAVNGSSPVPVRLKDLYECMATELGKDIKFTGNSNGAFAQRYGREFDTYLNAESAEALGIHIREVLDFLPALVQEVKSELLDRFAPPRDRDRAPALQP
jgi:nucleoside-diphosphate-sugar epimerase